jgi:hypothetical protein
VRQAPAGSRQSVDVNRLSGHEKKNVLIVHHISTPQCADTNAFLDIVIVDFVDIVIELARKRWQRYRQNEQAGEKSRIQRQDRTVRQHLRSSLWQQVLFHSRNQWKNWRITDPLFHNAGRWWS